MLTLMPYIPIMQYIKSIFFLPSFLETLPLKIKVCNEVILLEKS